MPHVLVAGKIHAAGLEVLTSAPGVTFELVNEVSFETYAPRLPEADALLIRTQPLPAAAIASAPRLAIVSRHGVGFDAVDVAALNARRIPLTIVGDVNSRAVAEHTLMLMLAAARRSVAHDHAVRQGSWALRNQFETTELDGKTLLLIGFGRIGRRVAQLAQAFGMTVMAHDPYAPDIVDVIPAPNIAAALPLADYVSLHMPGAKAAILGADELAVMKPSATIINAARGGLVDEAALDHALRSGRLAAAALDVFEAEPPQPGAGILDNPRVTVSPHSAGLTDECAARMATSAVENILNLFAGRLDRRLVVNADAIGWPR
jgi:D-3-phosphoglycerate dehydrogenase